MEIDIEKFKIYLESDMKRLYSDSVTVKDKELMHDYIALLSLDELQNYRKIYEDLKYNNSNNNVTHSSIKLTLKLFNNCEIKVFPYIRKIACKGWSVGSGTYSFALYLLSNYGESIYSSWRVKDCILKKYRLTYNIEYYEKGNLEIDLKENY